MSHSQEFEEFSELVAQAHSDFIAIEKKIGRHHHPAVRAAKFNNFITEHPRYRRLTAMINPDMCEEYLKEFEATLVAKGRSAWDENPEFMRHAVQELRQQHADFAYRKFCETKFPGSKGAKVYAFMAFAEKNFPDVLANFTENEAENTIQKELKERKEALLWRVSTLGLMGTILAIAGYMMTAAKHEEPAPEPNKPNVQRVKIEKNNKDNPGLQK